MSDIAGVSLAPRPPPGQHVPGAVHIVVVTVPAQAPGTDGGTVVVEINAGTDAFGLANLQDLVKRLPDEKLDPSFARPWRARLMSGVGP